MSPVQDRTVWFPKDFLLFVLLNIPLWGIGGLVWGLAMAWIAVPGSRIYFLFLGLLWGGTVWFFFSIIMAIMCREVSTRIQLRALTEFSERLEKAARRIRYTMEQQSPTSFACKPKHIIARLFEFQTLHVSVQDDGVDLIGPSVVVNKVRKQLLAKSASKK